MSVAHIIVNPAARHAATMPSLLLDPPWRTRTTVTSSKDEAVDLIRSSADRGDLIVVAGGDGSVNNAVNAIHDDSGNDGRDIEGAAFGLVPLGTANDFARDLGLPTDPLAALWRIANGQRHRVDLLTVNGRRCIVGGGFGLAGSCIETVHQLRSGSLLGRGLVGLSGERAYQVVTPMHLLPQPPQIDVEVQWTTPEGEARTQRGSAAGTLAVSPAFQHTWRTTVMGGFFLNQPTIGSGLLLAPEALRDDGVFELAFVRPSSPAKMLHNLWRVSVGKPAPGQLVVVRATRARLRLFTNTTVFADGETLPAGTTTIDVGILPGALSLWC